MSNWFYADQTQQRRGPVTDEQIRIAFQQNQISENNLVWTEGMAGWQTLASVAGQLGITLAAGPPPMPFGANGPGQQNNSGYPNQPVYQNANGVVLMKSSGGTSGCLIAIIVGALAVVVFSILAAIALPAYQDYTVRARLTNAMYQTKSQRIMVDEFYQSNQRCPETSDMQFVSATNGRGPDPVQSRVMDNLPDGSCAMVLTFTPSAVPNGELNTLTLIRNTDGKWRFETTIPPKYLPTAMRKSSDLN